MDDYGMLLIRLNRSNRFWDLCLPLNNFLMLPKLSRRGSNIAQSEQHRRLSALVHRFRTSMLRHIGTYEPRTATINQRLASAFLIFRGDGAGHAYNAWKTHQKRIVSANKRVCCYVLFFFL